MIFLESSALSVASPTRFPEQMTVMSRSLSSSVNDGVEPTDCADWADGFLPDDRCVKSGCFRASPRVRGTLIRTVQKDLDPGSSMQGKMHEACPGTSECIV